MSRKIWSILLSLTLTLIVAGFAGSTAIAASQPPTATPQTNASQMNADLKDWGMFAQLVGKNWAYVEPNDENRHREVRWRTPGQSMVVQEYKNDRFYSQFTVTKTQAANEFAIVYSYLGMSSRRTAYLQPDGSVTLHRESFMKPAMHFLLKDGRWEEDNVKLDSNGAVVKVNWSNVYRNNSQEPGKSSGQPSEIVATSTQSPSQAIEGKQAKALAESKLATLQSRDSTSTQTAEAKPKERELSRSQLGAAVGVEAAHAQQGTSTPAELHGRARLGIRISELEAPVAGAASGIFVTSVETGSAAEQAGLRSGDVIVQVEGVPLTTITALVTRIAVSSPGDALNGEYVRDGARHRFQAQLMETAVADATEARRQRQLATQTAEAKPKKHGFLRSLVGAAVGVAAGKAYGASGEQVLGAALTGAATFNPDSAAAQTLGAAGEGLITGNSGGSASGVGALGDGSSGGSYRTKPNLALGACAGFTEDNYRQKALSGGGDQQLYTMCGQAFEYYTMYKRAIAQGYSQADANRTYAAHEQAAQVAQGFLNSHGAD